METTHKTENGAASEDDDWVQDSEDGGGGEDGPGERVGCGCGDEDDGAGMLSGRRGRG